MNTFSHNEVRYRSKLVETIKLQMFLSIVNLNFRLYYGLLSFKDNKILIIISTMNEQTRSSKKKIEIWLGVLTIIAVIISSCLPWSNSEFYANHQPQISQIRSLLTTNTTRNSLVAKYCSSTPADISSEQRSTNRMYNSSLSTYFKANSTLILNSLFQSRMGDIVTQLQVNGIGTFVFISPFIIGLVLLILVSPCFLCCCCCQDDCPPKCCRSGNPAYANQELTWVTVFLVLTCLLIIATAIPSMTNANNFFSDFNCRVAQFVDNFQNGNQTADQKYFFSGISTVRYQLTNVLSPAISTLNTQVSKLTGAPGSQLDNAKSYSTTAMTSMKVMPNGANTMAMTLNYNYPLESATSTGTMPSSIAASIGIFSDTNSLLGDLYNYLNNLYINLTTITTAASAVSTHLTAGDMGVHITTVDTILGQVQSILDSVTSTLSNSMDLLTTVDSYNVTYSMALYGVTLGLGIFTIIGVIMVKSCKAIGCRHFLYLICIISFLIGIVLFFFAIFLAAAMSVNYYVCTYTSTTFTSPVSFTNTISNIFGSQNADLSTYFSQCFGGTNDFITATDPTLSGYFTNLKTSIFNSKLYNFTDLTTNLNTKLTTMSTLIDFAGLGHMPDFDVTTSNGQAEITFFNKVANKSLFSSSCPSGTFPVFYQDAWVPGVSSAYQAFVSCQNKVSQDATVCSSGISNVASCPSSRCINTFSIISWYYRGSILGNLVTDANTRYGSACNDFNDYLTNFANNYVKSVNDNIGNSAQDSADNTKLAGRFQIQTKTPVTTLKNYMTASVQPLFTNVYGNLSAANLDSVFNPTTGLLTGLDCRVLSQNGVNLQQALCIRGLNRIFFSLVTVGIMAFAMFLLVCCILCFNVRHYQHSLQTKSKNKVMALEETDSKIFMG